MNHNQVHKVIKVGRVTFSFNAAVTVDSKPGDFYGNLVTVEQVERDGQRWDLCHNDKTGSQEWVHANCDSTCVNGICLMCQQESPTLW